LITGFIEIAVAVSVAGRLLGTSPGGGVTFLIAGTLGIAIALLALFAFLRVATSFTGFRRFAVAVEVAVEPHTLVPCTVTALARAAVSIALALENGLTAPR